MSFFEYSIRIWHIIEHDLNVFWIEFAVETVLKELKAFVAFGKQLCEFFGYKSLGNVAFIAKLSYVKFRDLIFTCNYALFLSKITFPVIYWAPFQLKMTI